jgi:hypothetical protein
MCGEMYICLVLDNNDFGMCFKFPNEPEVHGNYIGTHESVSYFSDNGKCYVSVLELY